MNEGDAQKAPVKAGKEQEVKALHMVMTSDQSWPRVMSRQEKLGSRGKKVRCLLET